jgi:hypothetical protein
MASVSVIAVLDSFCGDVRMQTVDLNCDMGELPEAIADGTQEALFRSITSANVACGGHAGDAQTMRTTIEQALRADVAVGAHPGYPDRANFGRLELKMPPECWPLLCASKYALLRKLPPRAERALYM